MCSSWFRCAGGGRRSYRASAAIRLLPAMSRPGHGRRPSRCSIQRFTMPIRADEGWNGGCAAPFGSMRHSSPSARMASAPWAGPLTPKLMASSSSTHTAALLFRRHRSSSFFMAGSSGPVRALGGKSSMRRARTRSSPWPVDPEAIDKFLRVQPYFCQKTPGRGEQWGSRDTQGHTGHTDTWTNLTSNPHNRPNPQTHIRYTHKAQPRDEPGAD